MKISAIKKPGYDFVITIITGLVVMSVIRFCFKPAVFINSIESSFIFFFKVIILFPVFEEYLFRGVLQRTIAKRKFGRQKFYFISSANLIASLIFTIIHFFNHPPLWAASVFFPSILFGYFSDRYGNIFFSTSLHIFFNLIYCIFCIF